MTDSSKFPVTGERFTTAGRTITEADIAVFARLTGDLSELHMDDEFASRSKFGARIAHGALVFSTSVGLVAEKKLFGDAEVAFTRVDHLRFVRPVFIGDMVTVEKRALSVEPKAHGRTLVSFDTRVRNQHAEIVLAYVDTLLVTAA